MLSSEKFSSQWSTKPGDSGSMIPSKWVLAGFIQSTTLVIWSRCFWVRLMSTMILKERRSDADVGHKNVSRLSSLSPSTQQSMFGCTHSVTLMPYRMRIVPMMPKQVPFSE